MKMREKVIFDGLIDGSAEQIQKIVDKYYLDNLTIPDIEFGIDYLNTKQLLIFYPSDKSPESPDKLINGYIEIITLSILKDKPVRFRVVSCRRVLDLLFFQLSEIIQAKFIVGGYPPEVLTKPWRELITEGVIVPVPTTIEDVLLDKFTNPKGKTPKYGRNRKISKEEVKQVVEECRNYMEREGTIRDYYDTFLRSDIRDQCEFETFRSWLRRFS